MVAFKRDFKFVAPLREMASKEFVQYGRLCVVEEGIYAHKPALITDILDYKTVQIEAPDVKRQVIALKSVVLTDIVCLETAPLSHKQVIDLFASEKLTEKFMQTTQGKEAQLKLKYEALPEPEKIKLLVMQKSRDRMVRKVCFK